MKNSLDRIDWKLLHELQENARLSYAELGRRVGLTTPAVIERIHRLEESGIIVGYHAAVSPTRLGVEIIALVRLRVSKKQRAEHIVAALKKHYEILECHRTTGPDSFVMRVAVSSVQHLEALLDSLAHVGKTSSSIVLSSPVLRRVLSRHPRAQPNNVK